MPKAMLAGLTPLQVAIVTAVFFATLLGATVRTMLPEHDVFITDLHNARDVPLSAFMSMNMERHVKAQMDLYKALAKGEHEQARTIKDFYDEYFAVLDMTAEFYLETVERVFQQHLLAKGQLDWKGRRVNPKAIRRTALFTVEGERDDICAVGQTMAAHDICSSLRPYRKKHYMQAGVGHYGVFAGRRWAGQIYPLVRNTILAND